jgi:hypothetical protein
MSIKGTIIGVDLDGVCADFYGRMREIAAEWFERPLDELPVEVSYGLEEWGIGGEEQYQSLHRFAVTQRGLFETTPIIPGARKYLRLLSDEGARIRIITHRLFIHHFHREAVSQSVEWLDTHGIPYWDLCFMQDKAGVGADIYVEDTPANIQALRAKGLYTVCFANSTNTAIEQPRAASWLEAYEMIHRRVD